jgi:rRNA-processing protein Efg1
LEANAETERQKATRKLKKLRRSVEGEGEEKEKEIHEAEVDLNYIMHYPPGEKYISLFKDAGKMTEKRESIRREIERQMERGTLGIATMDVGDDDGGEEVVGNGKKRGKMEDGNRKKKRKEVVEKEEAEEDDFFEF